MQQFRAMAEQRDFSELESILAEDVVFTSPVAHKPYPGRAITAAILRTVMTVFEDFRYVDELAGDSGQTALVFEATVSGRQLTGCDFIRVDEQGLITSFMVMVRPLSAATALAEAMGARFGEIERLVAEG